MRSTARHLDFERGVIACGTTQTISASRRRFVRYITSETDNANLAIAHSHRFPRSRPRGRRSRSKAHLAQI